MTPVQAQQIIDEIWSLYDKYGASDYIGEPVSQIEHMSQAAELAMAQGAEDEVVLAAFFHDIGHICVKQAEVKSMNGFGVQDHEKIGGNFLRSKGFSERMAQLVESHVQAKRYLTCREPGYFATLSHASRKTLELQGGIMKEAEADDFERDPYFRDKVMLRKWDELAKRSGIPVTDLSLLKAMAFRVLLRQDKLQSFTPETT